MRIVCKNVKDLKTNEFVKEKKLIEYVINNINKFAENILEDEIISYEPEKSIDKQYRLSPRGRRIDLYVVGKKNKYIIEFKNPKNGIENRAAIGQLLDYGREMGNCNLILITTLFDINTFRTINHYNLPIRYIYFDKEKSMECIGDENEQYW